MEKRELICIGCPMGCPLSVELDDRGEILSITGHTCKRGEIYARKEVMSPTRIVTSTVEVEGAVVGRISVKTKEDIPKGKIYQCMKALKGVTVKAPVHIGDVVLANVADTGVDIIATRDARGTKSNLEQAVGKRGSGKGGLYMEKKELDINNMNGMTKEDDATCGLNDMNCVAEEEDKTCGLSDMNCVAEEEDKTCGLNDMNCLGE